MGQEKRELSFDSADCVSEGPGVSRRFHLEQALGSDSSRCPSLSRGPPCSRPSCVHSTLECVCVSVCTAAFSVCVHTHVCESHERVYVEQRASGLPGPAAQQLAPCGCAGSGLTGRSSPLVACTGGPAAGPLSKGAPPFLMWA